jgi:tetratricopeptide (TPR) repeat protein
VTAGILSGWDPDNTDTTNQIALDAGNHALQLDENSATAMAGLGLLNYNKGKWQASLELLKRASVLSKDSNPTYFYGLILQTTGYISEANQALLKAEQLDPVYPQLQSYLGLNAMTRGDMAAARVHFQRSIDGGNANGVTDMYLLELEMGNPDSAIGYLQETSALAEAGLVTGYNKDSIAAISAAIKDPSQLGSGIEAAIVEQDIVTLNYFGAIPEIMHSLNNSLTNGELLKISIDLGNFLWTPGFTGLRQLPEYKKFLTDIGLVDLWKERGWPDFCQPTGEDDFTCK